MALHNQNDDKLLTALSKRKIRSNPHYKWGADEYVMRSRSWSPHT